MRRSMMVVCALCCLTSTLATAAEVDYEKAVAEAVKAGQAADVNRLCTKWATAEPGNEKPRIVLGRTLLRAGLVDRAVEQYELAAEANPLSPAPRCELGLLFFGEKKLDMAAKEFAEALRIDPKHLPAQVAKVRLELSRGEADAALVAAQAALDGNPENARARALLADCLVALGDIDTALVEVTTAAKAAPENADVCYSHASALELAGRAEEAQQAWARFVAIEPIGERAERVKNGWAVLSVQPVLPKVVRDLGGSPAVSPDGKHVALVMFGRGIYRASLQNPSEPTLITSCPDGWGQRWLDWHPDGASLVYQVYSAPKGAEFGIRRVRAVADQAPESIKVPGQRKLGVPVWSPSGAEILINDPIADGLHVLNPVSGEHRLLRLVTNTNKHVYAAAADYMPDGKELVAEAAQGKGKLFLARAATDTGQVVARLLDLGEEQFHYTLVSEDGMNVVGVQPGKPAHLTVVATSLPSRHAQLCKHDYTRPSWHPEGRKLVACIMDRGTRKLVVIQLGGLDRRPVRIAAERKGHSLSAVLTSQTEAPQQMSLRWEAFDDQSLRIGVGEAEDGPLEVKPREKAEWTVELDPAVAEKAQTVKVTALSQDGRGAVKLVDWQE